MKRIVRLTERDLTRIVRRVIMEQGNPQAYDMKNYQKAVNNFQSTALASGGVIKTGLAVPDGGKTLQATIYNFDMNFQCSSNGISYFPGTNAQNTEYQKYFGFSKEDRAMFEAAASKFCKTLWGAA